MSCAAQNFLNLAARTHVRGDRGVRCDEDAIDSGGPGFGEEPGTKLACAMKTPLYPSIAKV